MKRLILVTVCFLALAIGLAFFLPAHDNDPINATNFAQIENGMTLVQVQGILGSEGDEGNGDGHGFPQTWAGAGRNVITVHFTFAARGPVAARKSYFNPSIWDRIKVWWGSYELHPDGSRSKRLVPVA